MEGLGAYPARDYGQNIPFPSTHPVAYGILKQEQEESHDQKSFYR